LPGLAVADGPMLEWAGARSGKFTDKLHGRAHGVAQVHAPWNRGMDHGLATNGFGRYFSDSAGLLPMQGRKAVPVALNSDTMHWKPSKTCLSEPGAHHPEKPEGKAAVAEPLRRPQVEKERRHLVQVSSKEEHHDRPVGPNIVHRDNGLRAADQPAREVDVSGEMARKIRTVDLHGQRNGLGCRSLGDKCYKHPEYAVGYHTEGSLIPGASFVRGHFPKTVARRGAWVPLSANGKNKVSNQKLTEEQHKALSKALKTFDNIKSVNMADYVAVEEACNKLAEAIDFAVAEKVSKNSLLEAEDLRQQLVEHLAARTRAPSKTSAHLVREEHGAQRLYEKYTQQGLYPKDAAAKAMGQARAKKDVGVLTGKWEDYALKDCEGANWEDPGYGESDEEEDKAEEVA